MFDNNGWKAEEPPMTMELMGEVFERIQEIADKTTDIKQMQRIIDLGQCLRMRIAVPLDSSEE